jgi:hypothetical protein
MRSTGPTCIGCLRDDPDDRTDRDNMRSSRSSDGPQSVAQAPDAPEGHFGGGGAGGEWPGTESAARADDPYFFPGVDRAAYYDADDHAAFDAPGEPDAEGGAPDTDTGAS